jgi:EAL domain-containing protein (putative c-di-GMP-specific phosphodiesterase class I)
MAVNNLSKVIGCLSSFKSMGISISMDDFGTGHSSLAMLQQMPLDILKIDRSFIKDIGNGDNGAISSAIIAMSHSMGLCVIAEGIENEEQLQFVKDNDCDEMQGFYYSKPLPADEFREFVIRHNQLVISADKAV